jgi:hypothetical protein
MMRRLLQHLIVLAVVLSAIAVYLMWAGVMPFGAARVYSAFMGSEYLRPLWSQSCTFDLNDTANLIVMANLRESGSDASLSCWWNLKPLGFMEGAGVQLNGSVVNMDRSWLGCGTDANFTQHLREAVYNESALIMLAERPPMRNKTDYYILVSKCTSGDGSCGCCAAGGSAPPAGVNVTGVAYALLDRQTNKVYW